MKVLVVGGAGFIGAVLCPYLEDRGHEVQIFDNFMYGRKGKRDIRDVNELWPAIEWAESVVNLAGLSNDPLSDINPELTWEINYKSNELLTKLLHNSGKRVIYASSCSVYGFSEDTFDEKSALHPQTLYAKTKMLSEKFYLDEAVEGIVMRIATVYGLSPMPRFDLVVNKMIGDAYFKKKIVIHGGEQWRPVVHVLDVARAIELFLTKGKGVYNVGSNNQNYRIKDLGKVVFQNVPNCDLIIEEEKVDKRSYRVNFDKLAKLGWQPESFIEHAVGELFLAFQSKQIKNLEDDKYYRVKYLKKKMGRWYGL